MTHHPPIVPCLWFDNEGEEAVALYTSLFPDSAKGGVLRFGKAGQEVHGRFEGSVMSVEFRLAGRSFMALNGGPLFKSRRLRRSSSTAAPRPTSTGSGNGSSRTAMC